ncbi:MAG: hypothetical protein WCK18_04890 [Prolixibacteraceae bacterium]
MLRRFLLLISISAGWLLSFGSLSGQIVTIGGQAPDYAGKELTFYTYREPVSHQPTKLATTKVGQDGQFKLTFSVTQTIEVYADLEKFKGTLVVEPGANYQISLPPFSPRTVQESASPYFEPQLFWLGLRETKPTEINFLVRAFLTEYNRELSVHTLDIYQRKSADTAKAIISRLEKSFPAGKEDFLNLVKLYSYAELELAIYQGDKDRIIQKYFATRDIALSHPAYQRLFSTLFSDYLMIKSQDIRQKNSYIPAFRGNFKGFVAILKQKGFHQEVAELVAVKCFYDGYYSGKFAKKLMLKGIKDALDQSECHALKEVLPSIISKIDQLQEGSPAPVLQLRNQQNVTSSLSAKGKFVYLAFFRGDSKACRAELDSLVTLNKKLNPILTVLPVSLDQNFSTATKLWEEKKYPWELTTPADAEKVRADYQVKSLPVFYLISPDMKLILSPALAPSHNFEALFLKIYRERRGKML